MPVMTWPEIDAVPMIPYYDAKREPTLAGVDAGREWLPDGRLFYPGARRLLRTGDQLVWYGETRGFWAKVKHPVWWRIQQRSGDLATHVSFVWVTGARVLLLEAIGGSGGRVQINALSRYIPGLDDGKYHVSEQRSHLFVMRPNYSVTGAWSCERAQEENASAALNYLLDLEGTPYPNWRLVKAALGYTIQPERLLVCSQVNALALEVGGVMDIPKTFAGISTPGDIASVCSTVCCLWHPER